VITALRAQDTFGDVEQPAHLCRMFIGPLALDVPDHPPKVGAQPFLFTPGSPRLACVCITAIVRQREFDTRS